MENNSRNSSSSNSNNNNNKKATITKSSGGVTTSNTTTKKKSAAATTTAAIVKKGEKSNDNKGKKAIVAKKKVNATATAAAAAAKMKSKTKTKATAVQQKKKKKPAPKKVVKKVAKISDTETETDQSDDTDSSDDDDDDEEEEDDDDELEEEKSVSDDDDDEEEEDNSDSDDSDEESESEEEPAKITKKKVIEKKVKPVKTKVPPKNAKNSTKDNGKKVVETVKSTETSPDKTTSTAPTGTKTKLQNENNSKSSLSSPIKKLKKSSSPSPVPSEPSGASISPPVKTLEPVLKIETLPSMETEQSFKASPIEVKAADSTQRSDSASTPPSSTTFSTSVSPPIFRPFDHDENHNSSLSHLAQLSQSLANVSHTGCSDSSVVQNASNLHSSSLTTLDDTKNESIDTKRPLTSGPLVHDGIPISSPQLTNVPSSQNISAQVNYGVSHQVSHNSSQQINQTPLQHSAIGNTQAMPIHPKRLWSNASSGSLISSSSSSPSPMSYSSAVVCHPQHTQHSNTVTVNSPMNYFSHSGFIADSHHKSRSKGNIVTAPNVFPQPGNFSNTTLTSSNGTPISAHQNHIRQQTKHSPQIPHPSILPSTLPLHPTLNPEQKVSLSEKLPPAIVRPVPELAKTEPSIVKRANKWLKNCGWQMAFAVIAQNQMSNNSSMVSNHTNVPTSTSVPPSHKTPASFSHSFHSPHHPVTPKIHSTSKSSKPVSTKKPKLDHHHHHSSPTLHTTPSSPVHSLPKTTPTSSHQRPPSMSQSHPAPPMAHMPPPSAAPSHMAAPQMSPTPSAIPPPMPPSSPHHAYASELDALRYMPYRGYYNPYGIAPPPPNHSPYFNPFYPHPMAPTNFPALPAPPLLPTGDPFKSLQDISQRPTMPGPTADPLHRFSMLSSSGGGASIFDTKSKESKKKPFPTNSATPGPPPAHTPTLPSGPIPGQLALPAPASSFTPSSSGSMSQTPPVAHHSAPSVPPPPVAFNPFMYPSAAQTTADVMALARMHATALAAAQNSAVVAAAAQSAAAAAAASAAAAATGQYPLMSQMAPPPGFFAAGLDYLRGGQR